MKIVFVIWTVALVAFVSAANIEFKNDFSRSISSIVREAIEDFRKRMPCGIPPLGIPILAPLTIDQQEIDYISEIFSAKGEITQMQVDYLNLFDVRQLKVNPLTSRMTFDFFWDKINLKSKYQLEGLLNKGIVSADLVGDGNSTVILNGLTVQGNVKYSLGLIDKQVKLKELKLKFSLEDAETEVTGFLGQGILNKKLNEFLSELIRLAINDNENFITEQIESIILPNANNKLEGVSLAEIVEIIGNSEDLPECPQDEKEEK